MPILRGRQVAPKYVEDYITEDNSVRIIDAFVETLDVGSLGFKITMNL